MKRRRREAQMQLAWQRIRKDVPEADVVVTNPTHVAVALKYDTATMNAPKVVAKGKDYLAQRIRQIAVEAGIPIVERKPLARVLFKLGNRSVNISRGGGFVPERGSDRATGKSYGP